MKRVKFYSEVLMGIVLSLMLMVLIGTDAKAATSGGFTYEVLQDGTAKITDCSLTGDIVIPETIDGHVVTELKNELFFGRNDVTSVSIPSKVRAFSRMAYVFSYCESLKSISVSASNSELCSVNGVLFSKDMSVLYNYPCAKPDTTYSVPRTVKEICCTAFAHSVGNGASANKLTKLYITGMNTGWDGVTFYGCGNMVVYHKAGSQSEKDYKCYEEDFEDEPNAFPTFTIWKNQTNDYIKASGIKLTDTAITITTKSGLGLDAVVVPNDAMNDEVTWSSSDTSVAVVDASGYVIGVNAGSAVITAKTDNGLSANCNVTVLVPVESVSLDKSSASITVGEQLQLNASVLPAGASDKTVIWSTTYEGVATVNQNGLVTAVSEGSAKIIVKTKDGGHEASCIVTVKKASSDSDKNGGDSKSGNNGKDSDQDDSSADSQSDNSGSGSQENISSKLTVPKISTPKKGKKKFTASWKKVSGVTGYQLQYSTSKKFKKSTSKNIKGNKKVKVTIKKLASGKTYYVRVRSYKSVGGKKTYSKWSAVKKVKVR